MDNPVEKKVEQNVVSVNKSVLGFFLFAIVIVVIIIYFLMGSSGRNGTVEVTPIEGSTFLDTGDQILRDSEGRPYVILFSTTWCSHCQWIGSTFDSLSEEPFAGQINLQHWDLDTGDNTLTDNTETQVPTEILRMYEKYNPQGSIPTFVFGGKYMRIGNGYERTGDLNAELEDFRFIINKLLNE
jgi:thiol-disulfide isomerase/thioredoxin